MIHTVTASLKSALGWGFWIWEAKPGPGSRCLYLLDTIETERSIETLEARVWSLTFRSSAILIADLGVCISSGCIAVEAGTLKLGELIIGCVLCAEFLKGLVLLDHHHHQNPSPTGLIQLV